MIDPEARPARFNPWLALLVLFWVIGLVQSWHMTRVATGHEDIYADVEQYQHLREILGDTMLAGFRTDHENVRALNSRRWRFQYSVMPTQLAPAYNDDAALRMVRGRTRRGETFHLIYEYQRRRSLVAFDREMRRRARTLGCELETFEPLEQVVIYRVYGCADG